MIVSLYSQKEIATRVQSLAMDIAKDYPNTKDSPLILLIVLNGAAMFGVDLARELARLRVSTRIEFVSASSYHGARKSSGQVSIDTRGVKVSGSRVLVVEDIVDTGLTLKCLLEVLHLRQAEDVKVVAMLDKTTCRSHEVKIDYTGMKVGNKFIVGYGLDDNGLYRDLPFIGYIDGDVPRNVPSGTPAVVRA